MQDSLVESINILFQKYKHKGAVIDSNLLLYYFIGEYNQSLVEKFKRTQEYGIIGYEKVKIIIEHFDKIITSPHILTEISNLSNQIENRYKYDYYDIFYEKLFILEEKFIFAEEFFKDITTRRLGITDSNIIYLAKNNYLVITADLLLAENLCNYGIDVINFNNIVFS